MALIACPECEGRVSDRALACPHCGFPVREVRAKSGEGGGEEILREASPALYGRNPLIHLLVGLLCLVVVGIVMYAIEWLRCSATRVVVTTDRTTLRTGILSRQTNEVRHADLRNVQVRQSAMQRLVNVGTLELSSAGQSNVEISVAGIPDPQGIAELIRQHR
jgi:hypothetical protein